MQLSEKWSPAEYVALMAAARLVLANVKHDAPGAMALQAAYFKGIEPGTMLDFHA